MPDILPITDISKATNEELVKLSLLDKNVFGQIIERFQQPLSRFIQRRTIASEQDVEDLLQDIFIKVYLNLNAFDSSLKFSSWIYRIAYNEVVSAYRKKKLREHYNFEDFENSGDNNQISFQEILADETNVMDQVHNFQELEKVKVAVEKLDSKYKEVFILRFYEGRDYEEIGDILQIPTGTVSTLISRAKKQLSKAFK